MSSTESAPEWGLWLHGVRPVPQLVALSAQAERLGAAALLLADEGVDRDLYVTLTAIASATTRITLIPAITNPHSRHPLTTAAALGSLAEVAPGRVVAGLGAGGSLIFGPMGLHPERPFTSLAETVDVVEALLDGKAVTHHGQFDVVDARLEWATGRLPLALAGRGPRAERLAAERADLNIVSGKSLTELPEYTRALKERARAQGRTVRIAWDPLLGWEPGQIAIVRSHLSYMSLDMPQAWRVQLGVSDEHIERQRDALRAGGPSAAAEYVPEAVVDAFALVGDRADVSARLADIVARSELDLLVFGATDYTAADVAGIARFADDLGLTNANPR